MRDPGGEACSSHTTTHTHTHTPRGRAQTQCTRTYGILEAQRNRGVPSSPSQGVCECVNHTAQSGHRGAEQAWRSGGGDTGVLSSSWRRWPWTGSRPWAVVALPGAPPLLSPTQHRDQSGNTARAAEEHGPREPQMVVGKMGIRLLGSHMGPGGLSGWRIESVVTAGASRDGQGPGPAGTAAEAPGAPGVAGGVEGAPPEVRDA